MVLVDDQQVFRDANAAACRLLRRSREEIVGRRLAELTPPARHSEIEGVWRDFIAQRHAVRQWWLTDAGGQEIPIEVAATADVPEPGRHLGVVLSTIKEPEGVPHPRLSRREREVTGLLARGLSGEAIARELFLSPETVRTHIRNAMEHVGARTRAQLVAVALRDGLIEL